MDWETRVAKWVNEGKVWRANETTLAASPIAVPTTTAPWALYNGEPKGGKAYVILGSYGIQGGTPAALNSWGLVDQVSDLATGTTEPAADLVTSAVAVNRKGNQGIYGGAAVISLALTVLDDRWAPVGGSTNTVVVSLTGTQLYVSLAPPVILPPGSIYSLASVASAVAVTVRLGNVWAEIEPAELAEIE